MPTALVATVHEWHDFYVIIGTGSASIIGAMFIVASISGGYTPETRMFVTPTVFHLAAILLICAVGMMPALDTTALGVLFGLGGLIGLIYSTIIWMGVGRRRLELSDKIWYAPVPWLGHAAVLAGAAMLFWNRGPSLHVLAAGLLVILVAGIRNAWDLILYIVGQNKQSSGPSS